MKYWYVLQYNEQGQYCTHYYYALPDSKDIHDYVDKYCKCCPMTKKEYEGTMQFYRVDVPVE